MIGSLNWSRNGSCHIVCSTPFTFTASYSFCSSEFCVRQSSQRWLFIGHFIWRVDCSGIIYSFNEIKMWIFCVVIIYIIHLSYLFFDILELQYLGVTDYCTNSTEKGLSCRFPQDSERRKIWAKNKKMTRLDSVW